MTDLIEVKTADLVGEPLNWSVAIVAGLNPFVSPAQYGVPARVFIQQEGMFPVRYKPDVDWAQGGPLIAQFQVALIPEALDGREGTEMSGRWWADVYYDGGEQYTTEHCDTVLIAACRAIVATEFGDAAQVPKELMP